MQPSAPLARVWVGGGVFKVGSLMASTTRHDRHDYCGCHVLEQGKGTIVLILPGLLGCCCRVGGGEGRAQRRRDAPDELLVQVERAWADIGSLLLSGPDEVKRRVRENLLCPLTALGTIGRQSLPNYCQKWMAGGFDYGVLIWQDLVR